MPKYRFTLVFDFFDGDWSFYCIYANSKEEALKKFEDLGCPNTFGKFYILRKIEENKNA